MSTFTDTQEPLSDARPSDTAIETRLSDACRQLKAFDFIAATLWWGAGVLGLLLASLVVDHWIVNLGTLGRSLICVCLAAWTAWFALRHWGPLLLWRINPVYAAKSIEGGAPHMKNSLINYLLLRDRPADSPAAILKAMATRAAGDLQSTQADMSVDSTHVIRAGYLAVALLAATCLYGVLSPKSSLATAIRVAAPWAKVERPTRVVISDVSPGDTEVLFGRHVTVRCHARGLRDGEAPVIQYSSLDGVIASQSVMMQWSGSEWTGVLPPNGAERHLQYRVVVGDGASPEYSLRVLPIPTVSVAEVEHHPPAYTGLPTRTDAGGDVRGVERAEVIVRAVASDPIDVAKLMARRADGSGEETIPMSVTGERSAEAKIVLRCTDTGPMHDRYYIQYTTPAGHESESPILNPIEVSRDLPPLVEWVEPESTAESTVELPRNRTLRLTVRALDPDFGVRQLRWRGQVGQESVLDQVDRLEPIAQGRLLRSLMLDPRRLALEVGDVLSCHVEARDNYLEGIAPEPHQIVTRTLQVRIVEPDPTASDPRDDASTGPNDNSNENSPTAEGDTGEGDTGEGNIGEGNIGEGNIGEGNIGEGNIGEGNTGEGNIGEGNTGEGNTGEGNTGEGNTGEGNTGEGNTGEGNTGEGNTGEGNTGEGNTGEGNTGEGDTGEGDTGEGDTGEGDTGEGNTGEGNTGEGNTGEGNTGEGNTGEGNTGEGATSQSNTSEGSTNAGNSDTANAERGEPGGTGSEKGSGGDSRQGESAGNGSLPPRDPSVEPLHDGEVIEHLAEKLKDQLQQPRSDEVVDAAGSGEPASDRPQPDDNSPSDSSSGGEANDNSQVDEHAKEGADPEGAGKREGASGAEDATAAGGEDPRVQESSSEVKGGDHEPNALTTGDGGAKGDKAEQNGADVHDASSDGAAGEPSGDQPSDPGREPMGGGGAGKSGPKVRPAGGGVSGEFRQDPLDEQIRPPTPRDKANVEYARKATDLVLEYLEAQKQSPDPELLKELGWKAEDLQKFVRRWRTMKQAAASSPQAARQWTDTLQGLGLQDPDWKSSSPTAAGRVDRVRSTDGGAGQLAPPPQYRDKFKAFRQR